MTKLYFPDGATSISWGGQTFEADSTGAFEVPAEAVADLLPHGLTTRPVTADDVPITVPISQWKNEDLLTKAAALGLNLSPDIKRPQLIQAVTEALKAQAQGTDTTPKSEA